MLMVKLDNVSKKRLIEALKDSYGATEIVIPEGREYLITVDNRVEGIGKGPHIILGVEN